MKYVGAYLKHWINSNRFLVLLIFVHAVFFIIQIIVKNHAALNDSKEYLRLAKNIYNHSAFYCGELNQVIYPELYTKRPPLYSIFIVLSSFFFSSTILILFFQNVLSIISIIITKNIFKNIYGEVPKTLMLVLVCTSFNQFIYANFIMSEILVQFLIVLSIYMIYHLLKSKKTKHLLFYQILVVLMLFTKPVFYLFVIPNILITYLVCKKINRQKLVFTALVPIIIAFTYMKWNYCRTGTYAFSSIQYINLRDYNLKYFHTYKYGKEYADNINSNILKETEQISEYPEKVAYTNSKVLEYVKKDIVSYTGFHLLGCIRFFIDPGRFDLMHFFNYHSGNSHEVGFLKHINQGGLRGALSYLKTQPILIIVLFYLLLIINVLKVSGFIWCLIKLLKNSPLVIWVILFFIVYLVSITGPLGASRFVIPILPLYLFISLYGLSSLLNRIKIIGLKHQ